MRRCSEAQREKVQRFDVPPMVTYKANEPPIDLDLEKEEEMERIVTKSEDFQYEKGIQHRMIQLGNMDDPFNTDNSWKEVKFWHDRRAETVAAFSCRYRVSYAEGAAWRAGVFCRFLRRLQRAYAA